jgi:hypothetical protein
MDFSFSREHLAFRDEVRAWVAGAMPPHLRAKAEVDAYFEIREGSGAVDPVDWLLPVPER